MIYKCQPFMPRATPEMMGQHVDVARPRKYDRWKKWIYIRHRSEELQWRTRTTRPHEWKARPQHKKETWKRQCHTEQKTQYIIKSQMPAFTWDKGEMLGEQKEKNATQERQKEDRDRQNALNRILLTTVSRMPLREKQELTHLAHSGS